MAEGRIQVERRRSGSGVPELHVIGELDGATCDAFDAALRQGSAVADGEFRLDLSGVEFMDSTCLDVLLAAHERMLEQGRALVVSRVSEEVAVVLRVAGAAVRFEIG